MSKVTLAFGSFALGVAATLFALSGSHTLSSAQGRITPQRPIPPLAVGSGARDSHSARYYPALRGFWRLSHKLGL